VLFAIDDLIPTPRLTPPSVRVLLEKLDQKENNIYFKHCKQGTTNPYSRYYIFHSINPMIINPAHLMIKIGNNNIAAVRITGAHKIIPLYKTFMNANPKQEWLAFENQVEISILIPKVLADTHAGVMNRFITTATPENPLTTSLSNKLFSVQNGPLQRLDHVAPRREDNLPFLFARRDFKP